MSINIIKVYSDINKKTEKLLTDVDWSRKSSANFSCIHSISSYLAMFTPSLPDYFIKKYSNENDLVMDNFSGRGTTALVARELNRRFVGNDLNPYSFVLSKFKISHINKDRLLCVLDDLQQEFNHSKYSKNDFMIDDNQYKELLYFYSVDVLKQLLFLRDNYGKKWNVLDNYTNAILAYSLGLMHGPTKKNNQSIYFSLDMPNTISMSPNYVRRYADKHNLNKPIVNIFELIKNRIVSKFDEKILEKECDSKIYFHNSTIINNDILDESVSLVITSPPYLSIVNYTGSNWLKLWLLGYERKKIREEIKLSDTLNFEQYIEFIKSYLNAIYPKLKQNAKVCLVVGDVHDTELIEKVWQNIKKDVKYKFKEIYYDYKYDQNHKATNMLNSKSGKATKIDKVLVIEKCL